MGAAWSVGCGSGSCGDASGKRGNDFAYSFASCADKKWTVNTSLFYSIVTFIVFTGMTARCLVTDSCLTVLPVSCV